jgi:HJR/Mrr/RecB family endonuclease
VLFAFASIRVAAQAKRYAGTGGNSAVQEALAAKGFYECSEAWVVTNSGLTRSALHLAQQLGVTLVVDGPVLQQFEKFFAGHFRPPGG